MRGTGGHGAGTISASSIEKNVPSKVTGLPLASPRRICRHSSIRRPRAPWVHAADLEFVGVLAADPDAEGEPAGRELRDRLAGCLATGTG